mmetsp:Transcript_8060/g.10329  ORF Transcript_8060/g.10329 Transcript_8060/m.10329 type:complete len:167 (-) Transcript_8060:750-1250(-)
MKRKISCILEIVLVLVSFESGVVAFVSIHPHVVRNNNQKAFVHQVRRPKKSGGFSLQSSPGNNEEASEHRNGLDDEFATPVDWSEEEFDEIDENAPPISLMLSQMLGINVFTYILAGLIAIFMSLNALLGPGWLGQKMGIPGTGEYTEYSRSLPQSINLNSPENFL